MDLLRNVPYDAEEADQTAYSFFKNASEKDMFLWVSDFEGKNIHSFFLVNRIGKAARGFWGLGLEPGEKVAIFLPKMPHAISCFYALNLIGAIAVFGNPDASEDEMMRLIDELDCQMVVACDYNKGRVSQAAGRVYPGIPVIVANYGEDQKFPRNALYPVIARRDESPVSKKASLLSWKQFTDLSKKSEVADIPVLSGDSVACILEERKGEACVFASYTNADVNAVSLRIASAAGRSLVDDPFYSPAPIHTFDGLAIGVHAVLSNQGYCLTDARGPMEEKALFMTKKRPTTVYGTAEFYEALFDLNRRKSLNLGFLKVAFCSGFDDERFERVSSFLSDCRSFATFVPVDRP